MGECKECPWGSVVAKNRNELKFKDDLNYLFKMLKVQHNISKHTILAQFTDYMEQNGEPIDINILYAYLQGRANFPFVIGIHFLNFLADYDNGKRRRNPTVMDFVRQWYFPVISGIQKFLDAGRELKREYLEKAKQYDYDISLE